MRDIDTIYVHYTATYPDMIVNRVVLRRWHVEGNGWNDVGYHWIMLRDGTEEQGRPEATPGAHVRGHNANSIGVVWVGGLERATGSNVGVKNMTPEQEIKLVERIRKLKKKYPKAVVRGHNDAANTQCPGFDVKAWWSQYENETPPVKTQEDPSKDTAQSLCERVVNFFKGV